MTYLQKMLEIALDGQTQGIWFLISTYTFFTCIYSTLFQIRTRLWRITKGKLVKISTEKFGNDSVLSEQNYIGQALYTYSVNGENYKGSRISPWIFVTSHNAKFLLERQKSKIQTLPNDGVKVFYNPKNPKKSYLIIASKIGIFITLIIAVTPLIFYIAKYHL